MGQRRFPYDNKLTAGDFGRYPAPGTVATDFTLPTLEAVLHSPTYTDAYSFDYCRIFRSEIAVFLLQVAAGYEAIPAAERVLGGPVIQAKADKSPYPDTVTLSASFSKKPVVLIMADGIDGDCLGQLPQYEPLYQATKDQMDWYLAADNIVDNQYSSEYYFPPNQGRQTFRKAITYEERAQFIKMAYMRYVNLSFPVLLDDLALHTENAYGDSGGSCMVYLVDKKGVIAFNIGYIPGYGDNYFGNPVYNGYDRQINQMNSAANIHALLENHGLWTGKGMVMTDWKPSPLLAGVKISSLDPRAGTLTVSGSDGKDFVLTVDQRTRLVSTTTSVLSLPFSALTVGTTISFTYDPDAAGTGHLAKLLVPGDEGVFKRYLQSSECATKVGGAMGLWCPAIAKSVTDSVLTVTLAPRPHAEIRGLRYWEEAGDKAKTMDGWMISMVKDWADHPGQILTFHLDRATEVLLNGNKATAADICPGDHLGVEIRPEQKTDDRRPFYIHIYRYNTPAAGQPPGTDGAKP